MLLECTERLFYFQTSSSVVNKWNSGNFFHLFGNKPDLKMSVYDFGYFVPKTWKRKFAYFWFVI